MHLGRSGSAHSLQNESSNVNEVLTGDLSLGLKVPREIREQTDPYAFESLSRYFDVIH